MNLSKEFNSQLFITTHSLETLKALKEVLEDEKNKDMRDEVKAINIVHTKKAGIKAYNYGFKSFKTMIDTETEIR
jgi:predicted metal-dependent hydrolase